MAKERKKAVIKPAATPIVPKKRETPKSVEPKPKPEVVVETPTVKEEKKRKSDFKTLRVAMNADIEERKHIADRVQKGELSFAYFAVDGENSYHYYFINKN
jgi:hypothetical protein